MRKLTTACLKIYHNVIIGNEIKFWDVASGTCQNDRLHFIKHTLNKVVGGKTSLFKKVSYIQ